MSRISIEDIVKKQEIFRSLNIKKLTDDELFQALMSVISFDIDGTGREKAILNPRSYSFPKGTRFYKIRKLDLEDHYIPLKALATEQDAWMLQRRSVS